MRRAVGVCWSTNAHHQSCIAIIPLSIQQFLSNKLTPRTKHQHDKTHQTREKSHISLRLVVIFITFIHLQHFEIPNSRIPMKNPLHTKPPTPVYASPTRFCSAQAIFYDSRNVDVCTVYPRIPAACIPSSRWLYKQQLARWRQVIINVATRVRAPKGRLCFSLIKRAAMWMRRMQLVWNVFQTAAFF
jgi:hypothetical protein